MKKRKFSFMDSINFREVAKKAKKFCMRFIKKIKIQIGGNAMSEKKIYVRSKVAREFLEKGMSVEKVIQKLKEQGDTKKNGEPEFTVKSVAKKDFSKLYKEFIEEKKANREKDKTNKKDEKKASKEKKTEKKDNEDDKEKEIEKEEKEEEEKTEEEDKIEDKDEDQKKEDPELEF